MKHKYATVELRVDKDLIRSRLSYDELSGKITWRVAPGNGSKAGDEAGCLGLVKGKTYRRIKVAGELIMAHRIAWMLKTGDWPEDEIDHDNSDSSDNSWKNLKPADRVSNTRNAKIRSDNTLGVSGVRRNGNNWQVSIGKGKGGEYHGTYKTFEEAVKVRHELEKTLGYGSVKQVERTSYQSTKGN